MRRSFGALLGAMLLGGVMPAGPAAAQGQAPTRWVMATPYAEANYHTRNIRAFIEDIEKTTEGRIGVQLHVNASLLPLPQIKRAAQTGQVQLGEVLLSAFGNEDPFFDVDSVPFLADTWDRAAALHQATLPFIQQRFERSGLRLLYMVPWTSQGFYTRQPLTELDQLKGSRFRVFNVLTTRFAELLGATPVTVQVAEIPQAFATNVVNVMFTSAPTGVDTSAWDFARHFTDVGGMRTRNAIFVNARAFNALSQADQQAVLQSAARAQVRGLDFAKQAEEDMLGRLRSRGMEVANANPELLGQLRAIGARQTEEWATRAGAEGPRMLARYRELLAR